MLALRDDRLRLLARPGGPVHARRHRRGAALLEDGRARPVRLDVAGVSRAGEAAHGGPPRRHPARRARRAQRRGHRGRRPRALQPDAEDRRGARREHRGVLAAPRAAGPERLLRARSGRGERQPGPLRRRALRAAARRRGGPRRDVHPDAPRRLRPGGQAAHPHRHLRAVERLLRRLLRPRPAGAHEDLRGLQRRLRPFRLHRDAHGADRGLQTGRQGRRPARDVPQRLLHGPDAAGRHPRDLDPQRAERGPARRLPDRRPGVQREPHPRRGPRARAGHRLRRQRGARMTAHAYEPVIGLEIHTQLATRTKMFCGCELSFGDPPNTHTCPVCLGLPGSLPVTNEKAIHHGLMIGIALGSELAPRSIFHRKNYFYPDLPKGYQISQYDLALCRGGQLGEVRLHRVHLEEDAAKLSHVGESGRIHGSEQSLVDFNRGGTPLVEIVTEPDLRDADTVVEWLKLLRTTLRQLGVSDVNMEEGSLRCDVNISLRPTGEANFGTKTELKNMNSFGFIKKGTEAEIERQTKILEAGGEVEQETLHYDPVSGRITSLRSKEEAHDYRYFPEPDLVPIAITDEMLERARAALPELPVERAQRFEADGIPAETAWVLASRVEVGDFYEAARAFDGEVEAPVLANWVRNELLQRIEDEELPQSKVTPEALARLVGLVAAQKVTMNAGKQVLDRLVAEGGDPEQIVESEGLAAIGGGDELAPIVDAALQANADAAEKIKSGNMKAIGAIIGHVMRETKGRADGAEVTRLVREKLGV